MQLFRPLWIRSLLLLLLLLPLAIHGLDNDPLDDEDLDGDDEDFDAGNGAAATPAVNVVLDLTDASAQRVVSSRRYVLVLGYASWCTRSAALMPEFAAAATDLGSDEGGIVFAKIDAVANPKAAKLYNIRGFPTVLFFVNGSVQPYTGGDTKEEIINWVRKRTGSPASTVGSKEDAENFVKNSTVFVAGFFERFEGQHYESFIEAAKREIGTQFIQINDPDVARIIHSDIAKPPAVWIQKTEQEHYVPFDGTSFTAESLLDFIELNKFPVVVRMTSKNSARINSSPLKLQVLLFANQADAGNVLPLFEEAAMKFKGKLIFLLVDSSDLDFAMPFLSIYGVSSNKPVIAAFNYENGKKFLLEHEINQHNLETFCRDLLSGDLPQHYKSEPVPLADEGGDLRIVVGKTFEKIVFDESKDVLLQITSPWCATCEAANKTMNKLATFFRDVPSLVIAQIDASANEHPKLEVTDYPSFLFYPAGQKSNPVVAHSKTNLKGLVQFVKQHAAIPFTTSIKANTKSASVKDEL